MLIKPHDVFAHYLAHGKAQQRPYILLVPPDFNAEVCLQMNPDVYCQAKDEDLHYSKHGAQENRAYFRLNVRVLGDLHPILVGTDTLIHF